MDQVLADTLKANLKSARTTEDKLSALILAMISLIDCLLITSICVKTIWEERGRAYWLIKIVQSLVASGAITALMVVLKKMGVI